MSVQSYGILLFQRTEDGLRVLLAHPGGPFWAGKDDGAWSIPKGLPEQGETALETARREFWEETGFEVEGRFIPLGELMQPSGKIIHAWHWSTTWTSPGYAATLSASSGRDGRAISGKTLRSTRDAGSASGMPGRKSPPAGPDS